MNKEVYKEIQDFFSIFTEHAIAQTTLDNLDFTLVHVKLSDDYQPDEVHSMQNIMKMILEKKYDNPSVIIDINGRQTRVIQETKKKAEIARNRVLQYDKPYQFSFLNGFERMIVHSVLQKYDDIQTNSNGFGKKRRLSVFKK